LPEKLGQVCHIFQGLVTGADDVFAVDGDGACKNGRVPIIAGNGRHWELEKSILRNFLHDVSLVPFVPPKGNRLLIFPYEIRNERAHLISAKQMASEFPQTWRYFQDHEKELRGRERGKWDHDEWYAFGRSQNMTQMETPKMIVQVLAQSGRYALDLEDTYFTGGGNGPYYGLRWSEANENCSLCFLQAILNSRVHDFYIRKISTPFKGGYWSYGKRFIEKLPVPESNKMQRQTMTAIVSLLALIKKRIAQSDEGLGDDLIMAQYLEQWVNALVYELFFPQELHAANLHFFDLIQIEAVSQLNSLNESDRLSGLRRLFQSTYASHHKLRQALYKLGSLDLARTIEGKA
jgi:hypothetical protein